MSAATHPEETLQDYLDGRLTGAAAEEVRVHLESCVSCQAVRDELLLARAALATLRDDDVPMPADLLAAVQRTLDAESASGAAPTALPSEETRARWAAIRRRRWAAVAGVAAVLVAYLLFGSRPTPQDLPARAASDLMAVGSGSLLLELRTGDAAALERYFAGAPQGPRVRVIDLGMMGIPLEGGRRHLLDGRPSALYAYRTATGVPLVCQMFEGRLSDLPPPQTAIDDKGFHFQVYTRGTVTVVFWQEGHLVCVLASEQPASDVIALARQKAMAPA